MQRAGRGAVVASVGFRGLGRSVAFASGAFLGGAGLITAFKSTIAAAEESQRVLAQTRNTVERSGQSWEKYGKQIEAAAQAQSQLSGFDDERLLGTFSLLERKTKDISKALKDNALAADIARAMNISLESAARLVVKAELGQSGALRRVGIDVAKNATSTELLAQLNQKFAGSAAAYANTAAGAQDRFRVAVENFQEVLGARALPTIAEYLNRGADWLNNTKNQERAMNALNSTIGAAKDVIGAVTPIVKAASDAFKGFSDSVGGTKHAVELLIATFAAWKIAGTVAKFQAVNVAAGEAGAAGSIGLLRTRLLALRAVGPVAVGVSIAYAVTWVQKKTGIPKGPSGIDIAKDVSHALGWDKAVGQIAGAFGIGGGGAPAPAPVRPSPDTMEAAQTHRVEGPAGFAGRGSAGRLPTGMAALSRVQRNAIALSMARTSAQQLAALAEQRAILANQIRSVRSRLAGARGKEATKLAAQLADLEQQDTQAFDQIASINEDAAQKEKAAADRIAAASKKRKDALERAHKAAVAAAAKARKAMYDSIQGTLRAQFGGKDLSHGRKNLSVKDLVEQGRKAELASRQAAQFRALGLTSTGDVLAPTRKALMRETDLIAKQMRGTVLDTNANRNTIGRVRKVLSGQFGALTRETKLHVKELLDALKQPGDKEPTLRGRALNPASLTKGLGLTRAQARAIQFRIAGQHMLTPIGASGGVVVHNLTVHSKSDNPRQVARETIAALGKESGRRAKQVRGPHAGGDPTRFG